MAENRRHYKFYDFIMVAFVTVLLCSNLIGPGKTCIVFGITFGAGNLFFPISYIFGDVLTEVYGFARARKVIWAGFGAMIFATVMGQFVIHAPADPNEPYNKVIGPALEIVFGNTWRIVVGSIIAFWVGDFVNCYVMAKMKLWTKGKHLWTRTIGSTFVSQLVDSALFYPIAFFGIWSTSTLVGVVLFNWCFKVGVEVVLTPLTYAIVNWLKKAEGEDYFDNATEFTPFSLKD
ncbi:MAG: queuosine precursor transporter [Kofleriaceae bacterium]